MTDGTTMMANGSLVMLNSTTSNNTLVNGTMVANGSVVIVNRTTSSSTLVNISLVHDIVDNSCKSVGDATLYTVTGLKPETEYIVSVKAQSYAGFGPEVVKTVTTMQNG